MIFNMQILNCGMYLCVPLSTMNYQPWTNYYKMILKKATVLIVDDDHDVLTAVKLQLQKETQEIIT